MFGLRSFGIFPKQWCSYTIEVAAQAEPKKEPEKAKAGYEVEQFQRFLTGFRSESFLA